MKSTDMDIVWGRTSPGDILGIPGEGDRRRKYWTSAETWHLVDTRVAEYSSPHRDQRLLSKLGIQFGAILQEDLRRCATTTGTELEALLAPNTPLVKEAWIRIRGWYRDAEDRPPPPARVTI